MNLKRKKTSAIPSDRMTIAGTIPKSIWQALKLRQIKTGQSRQEIIEAALSKYLANELAGMLAGAKSK